ncbi:MAG TPA: NUDIX hydrolase [Candidatus Saccharimonadales bacterium]|nr:NUDIX hydrolase [Candidatus Saccharimonadales bacterium]
MNRLWRRVGTVLSVLAWPALFVYLRIGARTRVVVLAEGQVLLVQGWLSRERWQLPGGGLHWREQSEAGAVRETFEETGLQLDPASLRLLQSEWCTAGGLSFYAHFFVVQLKQKPSLPEPHGEIVAMVWVPITEAHTLPVKADVRRGLELAAGRR